MVYLYFMNILLQVSIFVVREFDISKGFLFLGILMCPYPKEYYDKFTVIMAHIPKLTLLYAISIIVL